MFIGHARYKSVAPWDGMNTRPFPAEFRQRGFAFAHNGKVRQIKKCPLRWREPEGDTDSEYAFLWSREQLEKLATEAVA
ncbi:MAG: class II glutamine amidotransferase, partial [Bryobacteraceae bacterium]